MLILSPVVIKLNNQTMIKTCKTMACHLNNVMFLNNKTYFRPKSMNWMKLLNDQNSNKKAQVLKCQISNWN